VVKIKAFCSGACLKAESGLTVLLSEQRKPEMKTGKISTQVSGEIAQFKVE
jgi:hypothetical protein